jgi:hypothetical protein
VEREKTAQATGSCPSAHLHYIGQPHGFITALKKAPGATKSGAFLWEPLKTLIF